MRSKWVKLAKYGRTYISEGTLLPSKVKTQLFNFGEKYFVFCCLSGNPFGYNQTTELYISAWRLCLHSNTMHCQV